ncbi:MAG: carboxypeptidase-like regulatory domain-containing protein [Chitinispirillaceae bacterium]
MRLLVVIVTLGAILLSGCGGSSDHDNARIMGVVADHRGDPAEDVIITLLPDDYNPLRDSAYVKEEKTVTTSLGSFSLDMIPHGIYTLTAVDHLRGLGFIRKGVLISGERVCLDTLKVMQRSVLSLAYDSLGLRKGTAVYVPGTPFFHIVEDDPSMELFPGTVVLKKYDMEQDMELVLLETSDSMEVAPASSYWLGYSIEAPYHLVASDQISTELTGKVGAQYRITAEFPVKKVNNSSMYRFSWGDGQISEWSDECVSTHAWSEPGVYTVQYQLMLYGNCHAWSSPLTVTIK